jgi:PAS domain S-box-containing protein
VNLETPAGTPMPARSPRSTAIACGIAVLATVGVAALRLAAERELQGNVPLLPFVVPVMAAAAYGGLWPAVLATALGGLAATYLFLPPSGSLAIAERGDQLRIVLFVGISLFIASLNERFHRLVASSRASEQALRQGEERFHRALMVAPVPGIIHAEDGEIIAINERWAEITGYTHSDIPTIRDWTERAYGERGRQVRVHIGGLYAIGGRRDEGEYVITTAASEKRTWHFSSAPLGRDARGRRLVLSMAHDVTEWKRAEEALRLAAAQAEQITREREALLASERAARSDAERASRVKDEIVAVVSHELRTPLNVILGWTHILRRNSTQLNRAVETIERNARLLAQLVSDLLDVTRFASGKVHLDLQPVSLPAVIGAAVDAHRSAARGKDIEVHTAVTPLGASLRGDPARLQQVAGNLLSNAVKFTPGGGRIDISLAERDGLAVLTVQDTGQGIAPDFLPHVFERFRQADSSTSRRHGGLGLGLAIVRSLVEMHGGRIRAESDGPGKGSTFVIELPLEATPVPGPSVCAPPEGSRSQPEPASLAGIRVLVVDDEPDALALVQRLLEERDATVVVAASAVEALEAVSSARPHVLLTDIGMPEMDGYELLRALRAAGETVPAVALTAFARPEDRARALSEGFREHLTKPVEAGDIVAAVARAAGLAGRTST